MTCADWSIGLVILLIIGAIVSPLFYFANETEGK